MRRLSVQEIRERTHRLHGGKVRFVEATYAGLRKKCLFIDEDFGVWKTSPLSIVNGHGHPQRGYARMAAKQTIPRAAVEEKLLLVHGSSVRLGDDFRGVYAECTFIDEEHGVWVASPQHVLAGGSHPKRKGAKSKATCLRKYGALSHMHIPEIARKVAQKARRSRTLTHWKTGAELICVGGYEAAFVGWCNRYSIDFEWQIPHQMPDGRVYYVDARILTGVFADTWIEIKGFFRSTGREKWEWFKNTHPNAELWSKARLRELGILRS